MQNNPRSHPHVPAYSVTFAYSVVPGPIVTAPSPITHPVADNSSLLGDTHVLADRRVCTDRAAASDSGRSGQLMPRRMLCDEQADFDAALRDTVAARARTKRGPRILHANHGPGRIDRFRRKIRGTSKQPCLGLEAAALNGPLGLPRKRDPETRGVDSSEFAPAISNSLAVASPDLWHCRAAPAEPRYERGHPSYLNMHVMGFP